MNLPFFIAKRISSSHGSGYAGSIIKLAIITTALCIAIMILSSAVIAGFKSEISEKIFGFWGHVHITDLHVTRNFELKPIQKDKSLIDSMLSISGLHYQNSKGRMTSTKGGVKSINPYIRYPGILKTKEEMEPIVLKGISEDFDLTRFGTYLRDGSFIEFTDSIASREIVISDQTSRRINLNVGDRVNVHFIIDDQQYKRGFKVKGIYKTGLEEYDRKFAFIDMRILQSLLGWSDNMIAGYEVTLDDYSDSSVIADYVYQEILPNGLFAETIQEKHRSIFEWLELQNINERVIILLMAIVGLINMCTALLILILERSRMVGVLKSLGQSSMEIRKIFIFSAVQILLVSLFIGNLLALGLAFLQKQTGWLKLDEENYYLSHVPIELDPGRIILINICAIIITGIVMLLPSLIITRISPIKILRFD